MKPVSVVLLSVDLGGMQGSLNKMAPASRQWRQAADWARELAQLVDTMQTWLARQLSSALPFQKVTCFDREITQKTSRSGRHVLSAWLMHSALVSAKGSLYRNTFSPARSLGFVVCMQSNLANRRHDMCTKAPCGCDSVHNMTLCIVLSLHCVSSSKSRLFILLLLTSMNSAESQLSEPTVTTRTSGIDVIWLMSGSAVLLKASP